MKFHKTIIHCSFLMLSGGLINSAFAYEAECLPAKGKITNNGQPDGSTLGIVALNLGRDKYKCGLVGLPQPQIPNGPNFKHTTVCDNKASPDEAQAQVTFNTFFTAEPSNISSCPPGSAGGQVAFSFEEMSIPVEGSARGLFANIDAQASTLYITGDYNCDGGIVMTFDGELCFVNPE